MRYLIVITIATCSFTQSLGCDCDFLDSTNVDNWISEADLVIEGEYLSNVHPSQKFREQLNSLNLGFDILFKVTSKIKGKISTDTVAVIQFDNGSCKWRFKHGEKYVILGTDINEFICKDSSPLSPPPLSSIDEHGVMSYYECDDDNETQYWNEIVRKYRTVYVLYCTAFYANSETGQLIKRN